MHRCTFCKGSKMSGTAQIIAEIEDRWIKRGLGRRQVGRFLADAVGVNETTWRRWRAGHNEPNVATWREIEAKLSKMEGKHAVDGRRRKPPRRVGRQRA